MSSSDSEVNKIDGPGKEDLSSADENEVEGLFSMSENEDESIHDNEYAFSDDKEPENDELDKEGDNGLNTDAWGKKKSLYFNTDFVDEDRGRSYREEDEELAKAEEADALEIQRKHLRDIHSSAFQTSVFFAKEASCTKKVTVPEWKSIGKPEKLKALKKKWPQLMSLVKDFKAKVLTLKRYLESSQKTPDLLIDKPSFNSELSLLYLQLHFHYLMNISFYLHLKKNERTLSDSVVLKKTVLMKKLLTDCEELRREILSVAGDRTKKIEKAQPYVSSKGVLEHPISQSDDKHGNSELDDVGDELKNMKRAVNYKIVKNKGIMPYRRKEYRNPRVRQRIKFKKAEIKRKGQIKKPRKEVSRYSGEFSGIHANVTRSIKLK